MYASLGLSELKNVILNNYQFLNDFNISVNSQDQTWILFQNQDSGKEKSKISSLIDFFIVILFIPRCCCYIYSSFIVFAMYSRTPL